MNFLFFMSVSARRWPALFQPELRPIRPVLKVVPAPLPLASGRPIGGRVGQYLLSYHRFFCGLSPVFQLLSFHSFSPPFATILCALVIKRVYHRDKKTLRS